MEMCRINRLQVGVEISFTSSVVFVFKRREVGCLSNRTIKIIGRNALLKIAKMCLM